MSGFLTKQRYQYACVFLDHYSDYGYTYLLKKQDAESVIEVKQAFEEYCMALGVAIKHYHTDNGIFACKAWQEHCGASHKGFTYAGVNAHHQNGRVERYIRSLQELARCTLVHAHHRWPSAITANLWPYAV